MVKEKVQQSISILKEKNIDLWLTLVRETSATDDPVLPLIFGTGCVWPLALIITAKGETISIAGKIDEANTKKVGAYEKVIIYEKSIKDDLINILQEINPKNIALNFSVNDYMADGLSHGLFLLLQDYLKDTPFLDRLISSEDIVAAMRGRKSEAEIDRIKESIRITEEIWEKVNISLKSGLTEKEIARFFVEQMKEYDVEPSWDGEMCPSVYTGPDTAGTHFGPTDRKTEKGHILNMDFGVKKDGYCSDMQRTWYFLKDSETEVPEMVVKGFNTVRDAIQKAAEVVKPGVEMWTVDQTSRDHLASQGFEEFPHGLGHQVGRLAHDGGGLFGPRWERYGRLPYNKVEVGQVFTLEPRVTVSGFGVATVEEMIVVRDDGAEFLSHPQKELWLIK
jgi:Xaa-Pro aminopeptidase